MRSAWARSRRPLLLAAIAALAPFVSSPARAAYIIATSQACTGNGAGECETAPSVNGAGMLAQLSRSWTSPGFDYHTDTNMTLDFVAFSAYARASGFENPEGGGTFFNGVTRIARTIGHIDDVLTAGEGGAPGFFRIPLHLTGATAISWQNGFGSASLVFQCVSSLPGGALAIGHCPLTQLNFTGDESVDTVVDIDVPIVLGQEFEYRITVAIQASSGHLYGDSVPFVGAAQASFVGESLDVSVLDAGKALIPGAPISASESGFQYAPEPSPAAGVATAAAALYTCRLPVRRRRPRARA